MNETEKDLLSSAAERQGLPVSAFLRMAALDRARAVLGKGTAAGRASSSTKTRAAAPRRKNARKGARR